MIIKKNECRKKKNNKCDFKTESLFKTEMIVAHGNFPLKEEVVH